MASGKDSFILYTKYVHVARKLTDEMAGRLFKLILEYVNDTNPQIDDTMLDLLFEPIKQDLKEDLRKWESVCERNRENGKNGGRPKKSDENPENPVGYLGTQNNRPQPKKLKRTRYDSDSDSDSECDNDSELKEEYYTFDEFWNDYDKKVGDKKKIEKKWNGISKSDRKLIREHIPKYKNSRPDKVYRKDPSTYLNNHSWLDEIIEPKKQQQQHNDEPRPKYYKPLN